MFWRMIKSSFYKFRCQKSEWIHFAAPLLAIFLFGGYFTAVQKSEEVMVKTFLQAVAIAFPFLISVVVTGQYEKEKRAGAFQNLLQLPAARGRGHWAELFVLFCWGLAASLLACVGYGALLFLHGYHAFSIGWYAMVGALLWSANLGWYLSNEMICYSFGDGCSLGYGALGSVLAAFLLLGIGDGVWYFIPCSYGARAVSYALLFHEGLEKRISPDMLEYVKREVQIGSITTILITIAILVLFFVWGRKWQAENIRE